MPTLARTTCLRAISLFVLLFGSLWGTGALAQAVVLDLRGDAKDQLRTQIEGSLKEVKGLEVVDAGTWDALAKKAKLTVARRQGGAGVAKLSEKAGVTVAVAGRVTGTRFRVQLLDAKGKVLSTRTLKLSRKRLLSERDLGRLGNAVLAAVETAQPKAAKAAPEPAPEPAPVKEAPAAVTSSSSTSTSSSSSSSSSSSNRDGEAGRREVAPTGEAPAAVASGEVAAGASASTFKVTLFGVANWRSACLAPGSESCVAYKRLEPADQPPGRFVEFGTQIPYTGVGLALEFFPLAGPHVGEGLGVLVSGQRAWTDVTLRQGLSGSTFTQVAATDDLVTGELVWRFGFDLGGMRAYVGPRGGFTWRNFNVEDVNEGLLPGSDRRFGTAGLDLGLHISPAVNVELAGNYAILPGQTKATRGRFGLAGGSSGFTGHVGVNGQVAGILGYHVKLNLLGFSDTYEATGAEDEWTAGGVGQEFYTGLELGLSLSF